MSNTAQCPLDAQYYGIISESDHRNGLCLCPLCTCRKHICPSQMSKEPYPKSMYSSLYMENYQGQRYSKPLVVKSPNKAKFSQPVNFQTTSEEFYRPIHSPVSLTIPAYAPSPVPETKFLGKTSYSSNYSNWGTGGVYYVTQQHLKHTSNELQLTAKSSYRDNFVEIDKEELLKPRKLGMEVAAVQRNMGLKINNAPSLKESLSRRDFPDFSGKNLMSREKHPHDAILNVKSTNGHYLTNHQADFTAHPKVIDHRALRKQFNRDSKVQ